MPSTSFQLEATFKFECAANQALSTNMFAVIISLRRMETEEEVVFSLAKRFYPLPHSGDHGKRAASSEDSGSTSDEAQASAKKRKKAKGRTPSHVAKRVANK
jgi:hypothetical protein